MARFQSARFRGPDRRDYEVEVEIDAIAAYRDTLSIGVRARRLPTETEAGAEVEAEVAVRLEGPHAVAEISVEGEAIGTINLGNIALAETDLADDPEREPEGMNTWLVLRDFLSTDFPNRDAAAAAEEIINSIPAVDPLLGCLIRSALGATVGQTIRCYQETPAEGAVRVRLRSMARCLGYNAGAILRRTTLRSLRCMIGI